MSSFPFPSLIAVALSVMTYSLLQREWGLAILMGVISLLLFILQVLVSRQRQDRGEGSITPFILSIGKAVPAYLFLFVFVGLSFSLYHKNWILSLVLAVVAVLLVGTKVFAHILPEWNSTPRLVDESFFFIGFVFLLGVLYKYLELEFFLWPAGSLTLMAIPMFIALRKVFHPGDGAKP